MAQPAASPAGQVVVISIPVLIIVVIIYLCRHRKHKISNAVLGFVAGVLLAGTTIGATITNGVVMLIKTSSPRSVDSSPSPLPVMAGRHTTEHRQHKERRRTSHDQPDHARHDGRCDHYSATRAMTTMTLGELTALPAIVNLIPATRALAIGRTKAYDLARRGKFPCRVIRIEGTYRVPTAELHRLLGTDR